MIPTLLASQNQRYGSPIWTLIPNQFGSGNRYPSTLCESDARRTAKRSARTCRWKPDRNKEKPGWRVGASDKKLWGLGCPGGNSSAPFPDSNSAVLSPSAVSSQSGASQPAHAYSRLALFGPGPRRNTTNKLPVLDSLMRGANHCLRHGGSSPLRAPRSDKIEGALSGSARLATGNAYALDATECAPRRRIIGSPWFAASPVFRWLHGNSWERPSVAPLRSSASRNSAALQLQTAISSS